MTATCVIFDGSESDIDREGEEIPRWVVFAADDDGEPVNERRVSTWDSFDAARRFATELARELRVELVTEAMPA